VFKNKELIIFDLDGTIIDSVPDLAASVNYMLESLQRDQFEEKIIREWVGNGAQTLVKRALVGKSDGFEDVDKQLFESALEIFLAHYEKNVCVKTLMYNNVEQTLQTLHSLGYHLAIVTNKPFLFVAPILKKLSIDSYFGTIVGGDTLEQKKPHPLPLLSVCETLAITTDKALMIGDSKNDILAAKNANIESVGVSYGYNYGEHISRYAPEKVVDDMLEILDILVK